MNRAMLWVLSAVTLWGAVAHGTTPETTAPADDEQEKIAVVIPIQGELTAETVQVFKDGMKEAKDTKADLAVLVLDTPGGYAGAAIAIADLMDQHDTIEFLSYVHGERFGGAWSAGAFLVFCTDGIYLRKGTSIGARAVTWPPLERLSGGYGSGTSALATWLLQRGGTSSIAGGSRSGIGLPPPTSITPPSVPGGPASTGWPGFPAPAPFAATTSQPQPAWKAQLRARAQAHGHPPEVAEALADENTELSATITEDGVSFSLAAQAPSTFFAPAPAEHGGPIKAGGTPLSLTATDVEKLGIGRAVESAVEMGRSLGLRRPHLLTYPNYKKLARRLANNVAQRASAKTLAEDELNGLNQLVKALQSAPQPTTSVRGAQPRTAAAITQLGQHVDKALALCKDLIVGAAKFPSLQLPARELEELARELQEYRKGLAEEYARATAAPFIIVTGFNSRWSESSDIFGISGTRYVTVSGEVANRGTATANTPRVLIQFWTNRPLIGRRPALVGEQYVSVTRSGLAPGQGATFQYRFRDRDGKVRHVTVEVVDHGRTSSRASPFSTRPGW